MEQLIQIMLPPLAACLILTGICTYLGLHVVSREVIFVDLALAQIAALGSTFAFLLGFEPDSYSGYFYSLGFTFLGAAIFPSVASGTSGFLRRLSLESSLPSLPRRQFYSPIVLPRVPSTFKRC